MTCSKLWEKNLNQEFCIYKKPSFQRGETDNHRWRIKKKNKKNKKFLAVRYFLQEMLKRFLLSEIETLESNWNPYDKIKSSLVTLAETTYINIKIKYKCVLFHTTAGCKFYSCFHKL